jgi:hypothetical protein
MEAFMADQNELTDKSQDSRQGVWLRLRGALKDVSAEYGGGEAYLRQIREGFDQPDDLEYAARDLRPARRATLGANLF